MHNDELELRRLWGKWVRVIQSVAKHSLRTERMSADKYKRLHEGLMQRIEGRIAMSDSAASGNRELLVQMREECEPWVSLQSLAVVERHILLKLGERCADLQRQSFGVGWMRPAMLLLTPAVTAIAAGGIIVWYVKTHEVLTGTKLSYAIRGMVFRAVYAFQRLSMLEWLAGLVALMIVLGVWFLRNTKRY